MKVLILILTRGRVGKQKTLSQLPKKLLKHVRIVCPRSEVEGHSDLGVKVIPQPDKIKTISQKRQWVAEQCVKANTAFIMMDDDLKIMSIVDKKYVHDKEAQIEGWKWMFQALKSGETDVVGFGTKAFSQDYCSGAKSVLRYNYHLGFCFGMTPSAASSINWGRIQLFEDIDYTLQLFAKGFHNIISYANVVEQPRGEKEGGLRGERTDKIVDKCLNQLIALFPSFVSKKEKSGAHSMSTTKIGWIKAAKVGNCRLGAETKPKGSLFS